MSSKKQTARQHAVEKATARDHLAEPPKLPLSDKQLNQSRFPGETALTGEDRPTDSAGGKQHGYDANGAADRSAVGPPTIRTPGPATTPHPPSESQRQEK